MITGPVLLGLAVAASTSFLLLTRGEALGSALEQGFNAGLDKTRGLASNVVNSITGKLRDFSNSRVGKAIRAFGLGQMIRPESGVDPTTLDKTGMGGLQEVQEQELQGRAAKKDEEEQRPPNEGEGG